MALKVEIIDVVELPDDVLLVKGTVNGQAVEARGWQSAITNYYAPNLYYADDEPDHVETITYTDGDGNEATEERVTVRAGHRKGEVTANYTEADPYERPNPRKMTAKEAKRYLTDLLIDAASVE